MAPREYAPIHFVLAEDYSATRPHVELAVDGLLDRPEIRLDPRLCFDDRTQLKYQLRFRTETYAKLTKVQEGEFGVNEPCSRTILRPVNQFLASLDIVDQYQLMQFFAGTHSILLDQMDELDNVDPVIDQVAAHLDILDQNIDLCDKLEQFVHDHIPIEEMADAGGRVQDTPEMTFSTSEIEILTAIAMMSKLMFPLMGAFISKCKKKEDPDLKLLHCITMYTKLYRRRYYDLFAKLDYFVERLIREHPTDPTSILHGQTKFKIGMLISANILSKSFVNVNLYDSNSNLMKFITTCARNSALTKYRSASKKEHAQFRLDPKDMDSGREDGNTSRLENESVQSTTTADTPILIKFATNHLFQKSIAEYGLLLEDVEAALAYYERNPITVTPINNYLLCTFFGRKLGGGRSIMLANYETYTRLVALLQFILLQQGRPILLHALTLYPSSTAKQQALQIQDSTLAISWRCTPEFSACARDLPKGFGEREWQTKLQEIANFVINSELQYKTAPIYWDLMNEEPKRGVFLDTARVLQAICGITHLFYKQAI